MNDETKLGIVKLAIGAILSTIGIVSSAKGGYCLGEGLIYVLFGKK